VTGAGGEEIDVARRPVRIVHPDREQPGPLSVHGSAGQRRRGGRGIARKRSARGTARTPPASWLR
jgi:hypothetical protein